MPEHDVSHGDILRAIGNLEGKIEGMLLTVRASQTDIAEAFRRISEAEKRIAQGIVLAIVASIIMPMVVTMIDAKIQFGSSIERSK